MAPLSLPFGERDERVLQSGDFNIKRMEYMNLANSVPSIEIFYKINYFFILSNFFINTLIIKHQLSIKISLSDLEILFLYVFTETGLGKLELET